jgi:hypothetical protein
VETWEHPSETSPMVEIDVSRAAVSSAVICRERVGSRSAPGSRPCQPVGKAPVADSIVLPTLAMHHPPTLSANYNQTQRRTAPLDGPCLIR